MSNQPTPHDSVFRRIFGVPENAASQLRPVGLAAWLDLGRLARVPASFVDDALKWRYSDLLFTATPTSRRWRRTCPGSSSCSMTWPASTASSCETGS